MAINTTKYITAESIGAMIARNYKGLEFEIGDLVEWCAEAENNIGEFEALQRYKNVPLEIKNKKALLPCNVFRLLEIRGAGCSIMNYENNGTYLLFADNSFTNNMSQSFSSPPNHGILTVFIDYVGIPIDEATNMPVIMDGHQEACYWYCLTKLLFEKYMNNGIDQGRWNFIQEMYGHYVHKAKSSMRYTSREDMDRMMMIQYNMVPKVRMPRNNFK
jgi:hypothetical protein